ncbi:MAG: UDP-3-O-(3-hydroxymyristoyl)glucosamine N-acyltransferase [Rhodospirillaceae bacterium]|nr:MAG: UDP-3-O-(3-hydroxymyristoyl)glucosamine N-acyltransferase [Rhodospirillaceae bacterium]
MANPDFFDNAGSISLADLADIAKATLQGGDPSSMITDVQPLQTATSDHISFLENKLYVSAFESSNAGACLVDQAFAERAPKNMALLITAEPYRAYARVAQAFYPQTIYSHKPDNGIHGAAHIDETARLGAGCEVAAGAVIGANVQIGKNCSIGANATIGDNVKMGDGCWIGANTTVQFTVMGKACVIHPGARLGQDGFGFAPGADHIKVPQLGIVRLEDNVDIGANACIDRGTGPDTVIGSGTKIDNMVQIGHNVQVGNGCLFPALSGISGSTKVGNYVMMGGAAGIAGHLNIGDGARIAGQSGVMRDVGPGETVAGSPAFPAKEYWRQLAAVRRLIKPKKGSK